MANPPNKGSYLAPVNESVLQMVATILVLVADVDVGLGPGRALAGPFLLLLRPGRLDPVNNSRIIIIALLIFLSESRRCRSVH